MLQNVTFFFNKIAFPKKAIKIASNAVFIFSKKNSKSPKIFILVVFQKYKLFVMGDLTHLSCYFYCFCTPTHTFSCLTRIFFCHVQHSFLHSQQQTLKNVHSLERNAVWIERYIIFLKGVWILLSNQKQNFSLYRGFKFILYPK